MRRADRRLGAACPWISRPLSPSWSIRRRFPVALHRAADVAPGRGPGGGRRRPARVKSMSPLPGDRRLCERCGARVRAKARTGPDHWDDSPNHSCGTDRHRRGLDRRRGLRPSRSRFPFGDPRVARAARPGRRSATGVASISPGVGQQSLRDSPSLSRAVDAAMSRYQRFGWLAADGVPAVPSTGSLSSRRPVMLTGDTTSTVPLRSGRPRLDAGRRRAELFDVGVALLRQGRPAVTDLVGVQPR